jgi:hypothetical protein
MSLSTLPANIYTTLSSHAGLQALVANTDSPVTYRIDPVQRGHTATDPYLVYQQIVDVAFNILENSGGGGKRRARIQLSAFAPTHKAAYAVAEQARLAMRDATLFTSAYISTIDFYESDTKLYSVVTDYSVITS